jgi:hypothetical protein
VSISKSSSEWGNKSGRYGADLPVNSKASLSSLHCKHGQPYAVLNTADNNVRDESKPLMSSGTFRHLFCTLAGTAQSVKWLGYGLDDRGPIPGRGRYFFFFVMLSRPALGPTQPPTQRVPGTTTPGVKRPGREAGNSPPSSAKIKNEWSYTSTPCLHGVVLG